MCTSLDFRGGHSSAIVGIHAADKHGPENVILLNHDMHLGVEDSDIKRFKREVAAYIGLEITYANYKNAQLDQFDVCVQEKAFKVKSGQELCTNRLKTRPFMQFLETNFPEKNVVIHYGFDANEKDRIQRRSGILGQQGYRTAFPLATDILKITQTSQIGIAKPRTYKTFKHGNCIGCLKAGWQHWFIVYCQRPDIWLKGKWAEEEIGYAIHHDETGPVYLEDMEGKFEIMKRMGVPQTEHIPHQRFWADARKFIKIAAEPSLLPCECTEDF